MTPEQLEHLISEYGDASHHLGASNIAAARAELAEMRTPITPETLTSAGWVVVYKGISGDIYQCPTDKRIEVGLFDGEGTFYLGRRGGVIPVPTNMHDLGELVRLLGGAK